MQYLSRHRLIALLVYLLLACAALWAQAPGAPTNVTVNAGRPTPTITNLSVASGAVGATVVISGSGFSSTQGTGTVTFNGTVATASSWSALSITVTVPSGATTGNIVVQQFGLSSAGFAFLVNTPTTDCGTLGCLYVDNSCSTAGTGVLDSCGGATGRMTNLQTAITAAVAGTTIVVHAGNADYVSTNGSGYTGQAGFQFVSSGSSSQPIILRNAIGERPILRGCTSASTTLAACNRPTITMFAQQYITITSANCPTDIATQASLGLHIYGLVIAYDDGGASESSLAQGNEISCTEIERGYSSLDDGNWSAIWLQSQYAPVVRRNYIHDIEVESLTGEGAQSSRSGIKMFSGTNTTISNNTINGVALSSTSQHGIGFDCKADCVNVTFEKNLVLDVTTGWRLENQETPGNPYTTNGAAGSIIRYNLFTGSGDSVMRECFHFEDGKITTVTFHNNTCAGFNQGLGENNHPSSNVCQGITSYNNAFYATINHNIKLSDGVGVSCTFALSNYNRFTTAAASPRFRYNGTDYATLAIWQGSGFDANSTEGTDVSFLFTSPSTGDYTLQVASPLQSAGRVGGSGVTTVDIGAYTDSVTTLGCNCGVTTTTPLSSYYVRPDGSDSNAGTGNTAALAWRTINKAADTAVAGETVRVQAGTYAEIPTQGNSGTAGNTITLIADGTVNVCGWDFNGNSYVRLIGFNFNNITAGCATRDGTVRWLGTNTKLEIWNSTFGRGVRGIGQSSLADRCNGCIVIGNFFTNVNVPDSGFGSGGAVCCYMSDLFAAYNDIGPIDADAFNFQGVRNRFTGNYLHNVSQLSGHSDFFQTDAHDLGTSYTVAEGNFQSGVGNLSDEHVGVIQNLSPSQCQTACGTVTENMWRRNVFYNVSAGLGVSYCIVANCTYTRYYGNTEVDSYRYPVGATNVYSTNFFNGVNNISLRNNIAYEAWGTGVSSNISVYYVDAVTPSTTDIDYNLGFDPDGSVSFAAFWTNQVHEQSNINPNFVNKATRDFHLAAGSGDGANARGTAGPLTTASGSGTGTTFNVATGGGGFFRGSNAANLTQYSGNLVPGDTICVGTDVVTISSISTDAITVTSSFTWANGDGVYLGDDCSPDIGAYPYKSGGYTLSASFALAGGTYTVTPNDASLVRFVICYSDGIPYAVDNATPYTCTAPSGTFSARVYPLYASTTLWTVATP